VKNGKIVEGAAACLVALWGFVVSAEEPGRDETPEWKRLFNGEDLTGWKAKIAGYELGDNFGDTFRVEDGVLKVAYDHYEKFDGRFGHLTGNRPRA
jgi:hypothetical protein